MLRLRIFGSWDARVSDDLGFGCKEPGIEETRLKGTLGIRPAAVPNCLVALKPPLWA